MNLYYGVELYVSPRSVQIRATVIALATVVMMLGLSALWAHFFMGKPDQTVLHSWGKAFFVTILATAGIFGGYSYLISELLSYNNAKHAVTRYLWEPPEGRTHVFCSSNGRTRGYGDCV